MSVRSAHRRWIANNSRDADPHRRARGQAQRVSLAPGELNIDHLVIYLHLGPHLKANALYARDDAFGRIGRGVIEQFDVVRSDVCTSERGHRAKETLDER